MLRSLHARSSVAAAISVAVIVLTACFFNHSLFLALNHICGEYPKVFWEHITLLGDALFVYVLLAPFVLRATHILWAAFIALPLAGISSRMLKELLDIPRPPAVLDESSFYVIGIAFNQHSFPSGHTLTAFALAAIIIYQMPRRSPMPVLLLLSGMVGISRIAVGVHWPLDVLVGGAFGWGCGWLAVKLANRWSWGMNRKAKVTMLSILLLASISLYFHKTGFTQVWLTKYLIATIGVVSCLWQLLQLQQNIPVFRELYSLGMSGLLPSTHKNSGR